MFYLKNKGTEYDFDETSGQPVRICHGGRNWAVSSVSSDANGFDLNCAGGSGTQHIYWNNSSAGTFFKIGSQSTGVHLYKKADNP